MFHRNLIDRAIQIEKQKDRIKKEAQRVREKAQKHYQRRKPQAVQREYSRLMRKNPVAPSAGLTGGPKPPPGAPTKEQVHRGRMMERAERAVHLNQLKRLDSIDRAESRMTRAITQSRDHQQTRTRTR